MPDIDPLELASLLDLTLRRAPRQVAEQDYVTALSDRNRKLKKEIEARKKRSPGP